MLRNPGTFFIGLLLLGCLGCSNQHSSVQQNKMIVGATEVIHVTEVQLDFESRIDTGARTTSIHATDVVCEDPTADKTTHVGKRISFLVTNGQGDQRRFETTIADVTEVRNAQGLEIRYAVPITLHWKGKTKRINVNLRDRSAMTYKLLIGRDWLEGDYVVDVERNPGTRSRKKKPVL